MELGIVGLGDIGANLVRRFLSRGFDCVVFDASPWIVAEIAAERARGAASIPDLAYELDAPRTIWLAVHADAVDATIGALLPHLAPGDTLVDCARSSAADAATRAATLRSAGIAYADVGLCGGAHLRDRACCLAIGGEAEAVRAMTPFFEAIAEGPDGFLHCGPAGAGHFVRAIHDQIEHRLMGAYAEGFGAMQEADVPASMAEPRYVLDLRGIAELWRHGSSISSPVLDIVAKVLRADSVCDGCPQGETRAQPAYNVPTGGSDRDVQVPLPAPAVGWNRRLGDLTGFGTRLWAAVQQESEGRHRR